MDFLTSIGADSELPAWDSLAPEQQGSINLLDGALLIARDEYPELAAGQYRSRFDELSERVLEGIAGDPDLFNAIRIFHRVLFEEEGFRGNSEDFYDPRNSFISDVLDRKLGIPISLAVIYLEIANRLNMPVEGVGFPGHFLLKWNLDRGDVVIDPFAGGRSLSIEQLDELLDQIFGDDSMSVKDHPELLSGVGHRDIVTRMLKNLKQIYIHQSRHEKALNVIGRLLIMDPDSHEELRDRGLVFEQMEHFRGALDDLESCLKLPGYEGDDHKLNQAVARLRKRVQMLH